MKLSEIFMSIQGESTYAGLLCIFVRTSGCNLACEWCDTRYANDVKMELSPKEIMQEVKKFKDVKLIELTGGEPLLQPDINELISLLLKDKFKVLLETTFAVEIENVDPRVIKIVDMKCPDSGMSEANNFTRVNFLQPHDQIKFVINSHSDFLWAKDILDKYPVLNKHEILFAPVSGAIKPSELAGWIMNNKMKVRLQIQLHKFLDIK